MFSCNNSGCGLSHYSGYFVHCTWCNNDHGKHENDPVQTPEVNTNGSDIIEIDCKGYDSITEKPCGIHYRHKGHYKVHCIYCYPRK